MDRIYRSVFWLTCVYLAYGACYSAGNYGWTWHFDGYGRPETIAQPTDHFDPSLALSRQLEKPIWTLLYLALPPLLGLLAYRIWSLSKAMNRKRLFEVFVELSREIDEMPVSPAERAALHRRNAECLERRLGRRVWREFQSRIRA